MNKKGFTLIELAIVLIIIGVMSAGGVKLIYSAIDTSNTTSTKNQIDSIIKEIAEYSGRAQRIPTDFAELSGIVSPLTDSFKINVLYTPASNLTSYTDNICNVTSTPLRVDQCGNAACTTVTTSYSNIAFFVASGGINKNIQIADSPTVINIYDDSISVDSYATDGTTVEVYDDLTGWLTLDALKRYAGCEGKSIDIVENSIATAYQESTYSYTLHPKGGVAPYQWCVESDDAGIQTDIKYGSTGIQASGACNPATNYVTTTTLAINSNSADLQGTYPTVSKLRVYIQDANGNNTSKEYTFNVKQIYELVLDDKTIPVTDVPGSDDAPIEEITDFTDLLTANVSPLGQPETGMTGTTYNSSIVTVTSTDVNITTLGSTYGAACVWVSGRYGVPFADGYIATYFEFDPQDISNGFNGFAYAMIKNLRPPTTGDDPNTEADDISTEDDCGDAGSGMGYSYTDSSASGSYALYGNGFALEFDPDENSVKNDPSGSGNKDDHVAIVSAKNTKAYNVHNSSPNDICDTTSGNNGCYFHDGIITKDNLTSVRVEAYEGCTNAGVCDGTGNNVCVYAWVKYPVNNTMRDMTKGYMIGTDPIPFGNPTVWDCYTIPAGSLNSVRPGFTFSNTGTKTTILLENLAMKRFNY